MTLDHNAIAQLDPWTAIRSTHQAVFRKVSEARRLRDLALAGFIHGTRDPKVISKKIEALTEECEVLGELEEDLRYCLRDPETWSRVGPFIIRTRQDMQCPKSWLDTVRSYLKGVVRVVPKGAVIH